MKCIVGFCYKTGVCDCKACGEHCATVHDRWKAEQQKADDWEVFLEKLSTQEIIEGFKALREGRLA